MIYSEGMSEWVIRVWSTRSRHSITSCFQLNRNDDNDDCYKLVSSLAERSLFDVGILRQDSNNSFDRLLVISWITSNGRYSVDGCREVQDAIIAVRPAASFCGTYLVSWYRIFYRYMSILIFCWKQTYARVCMELWILLII